MRPRPHVLVVGDVITDIVTVHSDSIMVDGDISAQIQMMGGGAVANTATWLAWLGVRVDLVAVVGNDVFGEQRLAELDRAGVGRQLVRRTAEAPTGSVVVLVHGATRSMLSDRGANLLLRPSDVDTSLIMVDGVSHVHVSGFTLLHDASRQAGRHALAAARDRGLTTSVDVAAAGPIHRIGGAVVLSWLHGVDVLLANLDEARALLDFAPGADATDPADLARQLAQVARWAVVKLGPAGAVMTGPDGSFAVPAAPVTVVDPTGAGDAFAAGLLSAWLDGREPLEWLRAGTRTAALAITHIGGYAPPSSPAFQDPPNSSRVVAWESSQPHKS